METTNIKKWIEDAEGDKHADNLTEFGENLLKEIKALLKVCEAKQSEQQSNCNLPHVSKCEGIERETSCKHSDWIDLYYSSGDLYGRYCNDCGEFFE